MKRKLILLTMLTLVVSTVAQSGVRERAEMRKANLKGEKAVTETVVTTPTQQSAAKGSSIIKLEWVEFLTPQTASVSELFNVATGFARGGYEFCEILDLSGRLFPTDPTACINAAGVALLRGDASVARRYLQNLMTDQRAFNNIGLLYLLEGNRDKAEVYLQLAAANGNSPGSAALQAR